MEVGSSLVGVRSRDERIEVNPKEASAVKRIAGNIAGRLIPDHVYDQRDIAREAIVQEVQRSASGGEAQMWSMRRPWFFWNAPAR